MVSDSFYNGNYSYDHICTKMYTMKHRQLKQCCMNTWLRLKSKKRMELLFDMDWCIATKLKHFTPCNMTRQPVGGWLSGQKMTRTDASLQNWGISLDATWRGKSCSTNFRGSLSSVWHPCAAHAGVRAPGRAFRRHRPFDKDRKGHTTIYLKWSRFSVDEFKQI